MPERSASGKLIAIYDDNGISIDSEKSTMEHWFTDDTPKRFEAYGWNVIRAVDGHDFEAVDRAVRAAQTVTDRPSLICCKTIIGKGAPNKANTGAAHGAALGEKEVAAAREASRLEIPAVRDSSRRLCGLGCAGRGASSWNRPGKPSSSATPSSTRSWPRVPASDGR